jgi:hypothetical protein
MARHKWNWASGYSSAVCEKCGATLKRVKRKSKNRTGGGNDTVIDEVVTLKGGKPVVVPPVPPCPIESKKVSH